MAADGNLVNVGTVITVVVTRGPILEGIERDSEKHIPCTVCGDNFEKRLEAVGLSNRWANTRMIMKEKCGAAGAAWATRVWTY